MERPGRIPLFPLDVVLLPAMVLPLHIFEPRYKSMIGRCLQEDIEFGIVLASGKNVAAVGCTAKITRKVKDYPDGRMDILSLGREVFALRQVLDELDYYEGQVEYLQDEPATIDLEQELRVIELFRHCHALLFGQAWVEEGPHDPATLAYRMAVMLPMKLSERQMLLEMRDERRRRRSLLRWLTEFLPKLAEREKARDRARGNGHGAN